MATDCELGHSLPASEECAKANESVQRGGPNISSGQRTARGDVEIWFGRNGPTQTKDAARTGTGQVQSDLGACHAGNITSWHHKSRSIHGHGDTLWCFSKVECIFFPNTLQRD